MQDQLHEPLESTHPKPIMWVLAIGSILAILTVCCCVGGGVIWLITANPLFESTVITDKDFPTNAERLNYVNGLLPVTLPHTTSVTSFHSEGWQDWMLDFEGTIPQADIDPFIQSLPPLDQPAPDKYEGAVGSEYIEIEINRATGSIRIHFFQT